MNNDKITGRRLTNQESISLTSPDLPIIDEAVLNEVLKPFTINEKIEFENGSQIIYASSAYESARGNRSKIVTCACYDTETEKWVIHELDRTEPIGRYIPQWLYAEWLSANGKIE